MESHIFCIGFCLIGSIYLLILGTLFLTEYKYLPRIPPDPNMPHPGWTCIYASGLYLMIIILIFLYRAYKPKNSYYAWDPNTSSSDEDEPLVKFERKKFR